MDISPFVSSRRQRWREPNTSTFTFCSARMSQERTTTGPTAKRVMTDATADQGKGTPMRGMSGRGLSGVTRAIPERSIDDVRERTFYPRPHERANTFKRRLANWLRARVGLAQKWS